MEVSSVLMSFGSGTLAKSIRGKATVISGETIEIRGQTIRLHGIDASESELLFKDKLGDTYGCSATATRRLSKAIS